jgi:hypothetical protein
LVIPIPNLDLYWSQRDRYYGVFPQVALHPSDHRPWDTKAVMQNTSKLEEVDFTGQQLVLGQDQGEKVGAQPPGCMRAHQDVRVKEDSQETSRKTSSSVT